MSEKAKIPRRKMPGFDLKAMTCSQLADFLEKEPEGKERKHATKIRQRFERWDYGIWLLRKCGNLPAQHHLAHMKTAVHLDKIPEIEMKVGGGKPMAKNLPPFSRSLKNMHEALGLGTLHRWGKGAFRLKKP